MSAFGTSKIFDYSLNTKSTKTSSISSSSSSSSTTDFEDLLPDLWQTASEDDTDMKYSHLKTFDTPHNHLFQQQPHHNQLPSQQQLPIRPQPLTQGQNAWFTASPAISVSPPLRSTSTLWDEHPVVLEQPTNTVSSTTTAQQPMFYLPQDDELFNFDQIKHHQHQTQLDDQILPQQHVANHKAPINTQLYKTELCASFMKTGVCPYGSKCQFAHGENELKHVDRPPKWRSKPCANWSKYGSCRYGNRCCFKHGD